MLTLLPRRMPQDCRYCRRCQNENLFADSQKHAFARRNGEMAALGDSPAAEGQTKAVRLTNRLRVLAATANAASAYQ